MLHLDPPREALVVEPQDLDPTAASDDELEQVEKLRELLQDSPAEGEAHLFHRDCLLRFLRARNCLSQSASMHHAMILWNRDYNPTKAAEEWRADFSPEAALVLEHWACGLHGRDNRGVGVYYARYGVTDMAGIVREAGEDRLLRKGVSDMMAMSNSNAANSISAGRGYYSNVVVVDLEGFNFQMMMSAIAPFGRQVKVMDDNWPERLQVALVVRAPRVFSTIYKLVSPLLSTDTKKKIKILGHGADHIAAIEKEGVPRDQIPQFLGGDSEQPWRHGDGGRVAKGSLASFAAREPTVLKAMSIRRSQQEVSGG